MVACVAAIHLAIEVSLVFRSGQGDVWVTAISGVHPGLIVQTRTQFYMQTFRVIEKPVERVIGASTQGLYNPAERKSRRVAGYGITFEEGDRRALTGQVVRGGTTNHTAANYDYVEARGQISPGTERCVNLVPTAHPSASRSGRLGGLRNVPGDVSGHGPVEDAGNDEVFRQVPVGDYRCYGPGRGDLHLVIDIPRPYVQHAPEEAGKQSELLIWFG